MIRPFEHTQAINIRSLEIKSRKSTLDSIMTLFLNDTFLRLTAEKYPGQTDRVLSTIQTSSARVLLAVQSYGSIQATNSIEIQNDDIIIRNDYLGKGVLYADDYSSNYTLRSLVDKAFVVKRTGNNILSKTSNYTLTEDDNKRTIECSGTFNLNIASSLSLEFNCKIVNVGSGTITLVGAAGVSLSGKGTKLLNQWDKAEIYNNEVNSFRLLGDLSN